MKKVALLSMDVEDWHHLDYFESGRSGNWSMLDGMDRFADVLAEECVPATFFCLGELARPLRSRLDGLRRAGHELASHGPDHELPTRSTTAAFERRMRGHKAELEDVLGVGIVGYRAPCFAMDREKVEVLASLGFGYDSSLVDFPSHPLYGSMDLATWESTRRGVRRDPDSGMVEFEIPTVSVAGRRIPVAGGAYFRVFPWRLTRLLLARALADFDVYVFYIHPFECSASEIGPLPVGTTASTRLRFTMGRRHVLPRLRKLISLLRENDFEFSTFEAARRRP